MFKIVIICVILSLGLVASQETLPNPRPLQDSETIKQTENEINPIDDPPILREHEENYMLNESELADNNVDEITNEDGNAVNPSPKSKEIVEEILNADGEHLEPNPEEPEDNGLKIDKIDLNLEASVDSSQKDLVDEQEQNQNATPCLEIKEHEFKCDGEGGTLNPTFIKAIYNFTNLENEKLLLYIVPSPEGFSENCSVMVGDEMYDSPMSLVTMPNPVTTQSLNTLVTVHNSKNCSITIFFRKAYPYQASHIFEDPEGIITSPEDPNGIQHYRPRSNVSWTINIPYDQCSITFNVTHFNLGSQVGGNKGSEHTLDLEEIDYLNFQDPGLNQTSFKLLVGEITPFKFVVNSCLVNVEFISNMHYQNATGFTIKYEAKDTSSELSHADIPMRSAALSTWVSLNGVTIQHESLVNDIVRLFKKSIANIANSYIQMNEEISFNGTVTTDDVLVADVGMCNYFFCRLDCTSFHFLVDVRYNDSHWVFDGEELDAMLRVEILQLHWEFEGCLVCNENTGQTWGYPVVFLSFVMIFCLAILLFAVCSREPPSTAKRRNNLQDILSSWERDRRKRSVSEGSQSTATARSSLVKKKFTLPIIGKRETFKDPDGIKYDVSEFKNFGAKETKVDPKAFGFGEEPHEKKQELTFFSNDAFTEEDESEVFHRSKTIVPSTTVPQIDVHQTDFAQFT